MPGTSAFVAALTLDRRAGFLPAGFFPLFGRFPFLSCFAMGTSQSSKISSSTASQCRYVGLNTLDKVRGTHKRELPTQILRSDWGGLPYRRLVNVHPYMHAHFV